MIIEPSLLRAVWISLALHLALVLAPGQIHHPSRMPSNQDEPERRAVLVNWHSTTPLPENHLDIETTENGTKPPTAPESIQPGTVSAPPPADRQGNAGQEADFGTGSTPPKLLAAPDQRRLSRLVSYAPANVRLRLIVSTNGSVKRVEVLAADPLPEETLNGLIFEFSLLKFSPARDSGIAVIATTDFSVTIEPIGQALGIVGVTTIQPAHSDAGYSVNASEPAKKQPILTPLPSPKATEN